jgi:probable HAF family extracellular repeat protein
MGHRIRAIVFVLLTLASISPSLAAVRFYTLGDLPGGTFESAATAVSADGSLVVGNSNSSKSQFEAFRWTKATGMVSLPNLPTGTVLRGGSASADLRHLAANVEGSNPSEGALWTLGVGTVSVADLPGGGVLNFVTGISPGGTIVVGTSNSTNGREAYRWSEAGGIAGLGDLAGGEYFSQASDTSADGSIVVGVSTSASGQEAFIWEQNKASMSGLGDLPDGAFNSWAQAVSANGAVAVGFGSSASGTEAFRWTSAQGMQGLGDLPGGESRSSASYVSSDGSLIVGYATSSLGTHALLWDANLQKHIIQDVVAAEGLSLPGWRLAFAYGISDNGRHIVGGGFNPTGNYEAWLVSFLPDPPTTALTGKVKVRAKKNGRFKIQGTATDDAAVVRVEYQVGGKGTWQTAGGTGGWLVTAKLKKSVAKTSVLVRSVDEDGQTSQPISVKVVR